MPEQTDDSGNENVSAAPEHDPDLERVRAGDPAAFDALFARYAPRVMGYALRMTGGDRAEAEDMVSETFLAGYAGCAAYQGRSRPLAWLLGIASRRWRDRKRRPCPKVAPLETDEDVGAGGAAQGPEEATVRALTLAEALDKLEPPYREALLLVAAQGLTYREAAETTGEPVGTVKWRVHEATRRMRSLLEAAEGDGRESGEPGKEKRHDA
jgi:RNA polymerase sigma-70 factor, ECF subfamily